MLHKLDQGRLDAVLQVIEDAELRFPVVFLAELTSTDKGNVSRYLKGKLAMPDNFFTTVMAELPKQKKADSYTAERRDKKNNQEKSGVPVILKTSMKKEGKFNYTRSGTI